MKSIGLAASLLLASSSAFIGGCGIIAGLGDVTAAPEQDGATSADGSIAPEASAPSEGGAAGDATIADANGGGDDATTNADDAGDAGAPSDTGADGAGGGDTGTKEGGSGGASPLGAPCNPDAGASQCASGFCVDDVCCESACSGQCEVCGGDAGVCAPVTSGPPKGSRAACVGGGTSCAGACAAGNTAGCTYPGSSVACRGASCAAGIETEAAGCNGSGSCPALTTVACNPLACNAGGTACAGACTLDSQCSSPTPYCNSGACLSTKANGETCTAASQCTNSECVDGYCCNSACTGQCQACNVAGSLGACTQVVSGQPVGSRTACTGDGTTPCGGSCTTASATACTYPVVSCRDASCTSGSETAAATCSGGTCPTAKVTSCGLAVCNPATASCYASCSGDGDCASNAYCAANGTCTAQKTVSETCNTGAGKDCDTAGCRECASGACVDGYCCSTACTGSCQTCSATPGTCTTASTGTACGPNGSGEECTGTTCACPAASPNLCSNVCTNTQTDPSNCGGCGKPCAGICSDSVCYPVSVVATGVDAYDLATDGTNVYWTGSNNGDIYQCPVTGCGSSPLAIAQNQNAPESIATDGVNVYWGLGACCGEGAILSVPVGGGTVSTLATGGQPSWIALGGGGNAIDGTKGGASTVFWTDDGASELLGCSASGLFSSTGTVIASGLTTPVGIWTGKANVYFTDFDPTNGGVFSCPLQLTTCSPTTIASDQADPEFVTADDSGNVYWPTRSGNNGYLWSSSAGATPLYTDTVGAFFGLTTDGVNLYALGAQGLMKCAVGGCTNPTVMGPGYGYRPVLDTSYVYWTYGSEIVRAPK